MIQQIHQIIFYVHLYQGIPISTTSDMQMIYHSNGKKWRGTKELLDEHEKGRVKKLAWNSTFQKLRSWHPVPSLHGKKMRKQWKQWQTLFSWAPKSLQMVIAVMKLKMLAPWKKSRGQLSILKWRGISLPTKVHIVKAMVFPVVMCGCESCTIKKLSTEELMILNCSVGKDSWESLGL